MLKKLGKNENGLFIKFDFENKLRSKESKIRIDWYKTLPKASKAMLGVQKVVDKSSVDYILLELIRASQINKCAHCLDMYTKDGHDNDTINKYIFHSCHHSLYHLAQVIYLRRVLDRNWKSPIDDWDKVTWIIANY